MEWLPTVLSFLSSIIVAFIAIIPSIKNNRKKTQDSIKESNEATEKRFDAIQTSMRQNNEATEKRFDAMQTAFEDHVIDYEAAKAQSQRYRILRFYDEVCEGRKHSESHFEDILDDIDAYEHYCDTHSEFKNSRGHVAMQYIRDIYAKVKAKGGFLTHDDGHAA